MANSSSTGGGRRGGRVSSTMSMSEAKKVNTQSGSKPTLGTTASNNQAKVTNGKKTSK